MAGMKRQRRAAALAANTGRGDDECPLCLDLRKPQDPPPPGCQPRARPPFCARLIPDQPTHDLPPCDRADFTLPPGFFISPSRIKRAGDGVFTNNELAKHTIFGPYLGKRTKKNPRNDEEDGSYVWSLKPTRFGFINGREKKESNWLRYINHASGAGGLKANMDTYDNGTDGKLYYVTLRAIEAGSELYVNYGDDYPLPPGPPKLHRWSNLRASRRLLRDPCPVCDEVTCNPKRCNNLYNSERPREGAEPDQASLPKALEVVRRGDEVEIQARQLIRRGSFFGPYKGRKSYAHIYNVWKVTGPRKGTFYLSDKKAANRNYMFYIQTAKEGERWNLKAKEVNYGIYYEATEDIQYQDTLHLRP